VDKRAAGWSGTIPAFIDEESRSIREALQEFIEDAGEPQIRAWQSSIPQLKNIMKDYLTDRHDDKNATVLEYALPMEQGRRPDVIILDNGIVVVLELKGYGTTKQEDIDQVSAYARDLRHYHSMCVDREVIPILVPLRKRGDWVKTDDVTICGPDLLPMLLQEITANSVASNLEGDEFLNGDYVPMPTLVEAARSMFENEDLPNIRKARSATDPALNTSINIIQDAAQSRTRKLIILSGVPGAGKTLVGIRLSYDRSTLKHVIPRLVNRPGGKKEPIIPSISSVFMSGNGPLVEVLQDALGKNSKNFVRSVLSYKKYHFGDVGKDRIPFEHVLIFDEAQRAWDKEKVERQHKGEFVGSEPDLFVNMAERIPEWSVIVALIGSGQEIHDGEESGIQLWVDAVAGSIQPERWQICAAPEIIEELETGEISIRPEKFLNLDVTLRSHFAEYLHEWVDGLIGERNFSSSELKSKAQKLQSEGFRMYWTDDIEVAKSYMINRYEGIESKRYGMIASSRDRSLHSIFHNDFMFYKNVRKGAWFNRPKDDQLSSYQLKSSMTEFGIQGLELDFCLIGWGTDYILNEGEWTNQFAVKHKIPVRNSLILRRKSYKVLLTRSRDGFIIYVPSDEVLDTKYHGCLKETRDWLISCGISKLIV